MKGVFNALRSSKNAEEELLQSVNGNLNAVKAAREVMTQDFNRRRWQPVGCALFHLTVILKFHTQIEPFLYPYTVAAALTTLYIHIAVEERRHIVLALRAEELRLTQEKEQKEQEKYYLKNGKEQTNDSVPNKKD